MARRVPEYAVGAMMEACHCKTAESITSPILICLYMPYLASRGGDGYPVTGVRVRERGNGVDVVVR